MYENIRRIKIKVKGIVQGVGFRPTIAKQAVASGLTGTVANARDSVEIEIQGKPDAVQKYIDTFYSFIPENSVISSFCIEDVQINPAEVSFEIIESSEAGPTRFSIPPDIAMCDSCRTEFYDKNNRRYKFPFITCGNCGPRYTYMKDMPYDRNKTAMAEFPFCPQCLEEYINPDDRRYHIEGFSCPQCGPTLTGYQDTIAALLEGKIAAIKGLGGYHIACSALDDNAVQTLRDRKKRRGKPFAVMFRSIEMAEEYTELLPEEIKLLQSKISPIVIVKKKKNCLISEKVAPDNAYLGIMIAYTPLHQLILDSLNIPLIMTSANISGDPLIIDDAKAKAELVEIVDVFLIHNRQIYKRADDSISWMHDGQEINIRMGRGKMPFPVNLSSDFGKKILAVGAELKSNISVISGDNLVTSNHIGDLETPETFKHFRDTVSEMLEYYDLMPDIVVADKHPDYESSSFAEDFSKQHTIQLLRVQHHYSHFLSCYFENNLTDPAIGIILDGTGYGDDGTIWGGEIITGDLYSYTRAGHLGQFPLPGGEKSIIEPWRLLSGILVKNEYIDACNWINPEILEKISIISGNRNFSPLTSSAGRLFDAAASLLGFHQNVSYEAEAAIFLEMLAMSSSTRDSILTRIINDNGFYILDTNSLIKEIYRLLKIGERRERLAKIFHNSLIDGISEMVYFISSEKNTKNVLLSGGVFQNRIMLTGFKKRLASMGLKVFFNSRIPANDAGISTGQAIYGVYNA